MYNYVQRLWLGNWEPNLGLLKEQYMILIPEPSLWSHFFLKL